MGNSEMTNYEGTSLETLVSQDFFESQFILVPRAYDPSGLR